MTDQSEKKSLGRVLLVEDDMPMIKMYSTKLNLEGFTVTEAHDGEAGLEKLRTEGADLVILDLMIPKLGGMGVLQAIRDDAKLAKTPVIILSNLSQEQDIQKASGLSVKHFLIKSNHTPSQVVEIVKSYFGSGRPEPVPAPEPSN